MNCIASKIILGVDSSLFDIESTISDGLKDVIEKAKPIGGLDMDQRVVQMIQTKPSSSRISGRSRRRTVWARQDIQQTTTAGHRIEQAVQADEIYVHLERPKRIMGVKRNDHVCADNRRTPTKQVSDVDSARY